MIDRERLLGLDHESLAWRKALVDLADQLYRATAGITHPYGTALHQRLSNPVPGDYVYEVTSLRPDYPDAQKWAVGSGFLLRVTREPMYGPGEWDVEAEGRPIPTEDVWHVQYGPVGEGDNPDPDKVDVVTWRDCRFGVVPLDPGEGEWIKLWRGA